MHPQILPIHFRGTWVQIQHAKLPLPCLNPPFKRSEDQSWVLAVTVPACERCLSLCRSFDRAVEEWRQFHCDMNDLGQWLSDTETLLSESVGADGQLDLDSARQHQEVSLGRSSTIIFTLLDLTYISPDWNLIKSRACCIIAYFLRCILNVLGVPARSLRRLISQIYSLMFPYVYKLRATLLALQDAAVICLK